ncbi:MAG TPA: pyridoxamine 5'-phosphate oxidase family protein [Archangium sp.]
MPFEASLERNAPQREVQVATVSPEGLPFVRTVFLRGLSEDGVPSFFTDSRSRKADHLRTTPRMQVLAWFPKTGEQFRLSGRVALHGVQAEPPWREFRQRGWETLPADERILYVGPPPGFPAVTVGQIAVPHEAPAEFLLVTLDVNEVDWLTMGPPRRRLSFRVMGPTWVEQGLTP